MADDVTVPEEAPDERQDLQVALAGAQQLLGLLRGLRASEAIMRTLHTAERRSDELLASIDKRKAQLALLEQEYAAKLAVSEEAHQAAKARYFS